MSQDSEIKERVQLDVALANPVLLVGECQTVYLRIGLTGFPRQDQSEPLVPINLALAIDTSNSMLGVKLYQAKQAAMMIVARLRPQDMVAIVNYGHQGKVLLPTTKVQDREMINHLIQMLRAKGQTALFDGLEKAAKQIRQSWRQAQINRIILLSDGLANVGLSSLEEIDKLWRSLGLADIVITTIGLGLDYDEDLMMGLSQQSDGNYAFVENATDMTRVFEQEFLDMASMVAQEVELTVSCGEGVRPLKVFNQEAKIEEQTVSIQLNQLRAEQERYILVELEISHSLSRKKRKLADVSVMYHNLKTRRRQRVKDKVTATFTESLQQVAENTNAMVMISVAEQLAVEKNKLALQLRDQGEIESAKQLLLENASFLAQEAAKYNAHSLERLGTLNLADANHLDEDCWVKQRKSMRQEQFHLSYQQNCSACKLDLLD